MKALFLIFHGFAAYNGISKKILYQVDALRSCGAEVELCHLKIDEHGRQLRMVDDRVLQDYGNDTLAKIRKRCCYGELTRYVIDNGIELVYIRSVHNANPFINRMVRTLHCNGVKVVMEIPTFPYEKQYEHSSLKNKMQLKIDILFRRTMAKYLDRIVTFSDDDTIFGVPTIRISNGIDFEHIPIKVRINDTSHEINLIGVADIHFWHGFDRMIEGLAVYYNRERGRRVIFHIVGNGVEAELARLRELTQRYNLTDYVVFHGPLSGDALDDTFERSDIGIASLARHRSGITKIKTLKNREYAARGIPFIYSETDDDFDRMPYVMRVPADESPVDVDSVIGFCDANQFTSGDIRRSIVESLSWRTQMQKVLDQSQV